MECSHPFSCQCQPIANVNVLGAQLTRIELSFHRAISVLSISQVSIWVKSLNTQHRWVKLDFNACHKNDSNNFTLFIQPDVHCLTTKLLHFDVE